MNYPPAQILALIESIVKLSWKWTFPSNVETTNADRRLFEYTEWEKITENPWGKWKNWTNISQEKYTTQAKWLEQLGVRRAK